MNPAQRHQQPPIEMQAIQKPYNTQHKVLSQCDENQNRPDSQQYLPSPFAPSVQNLPDPIYQQPPPNVQNLPDTIYQQPPPNVQNLPDTIYQQPPQNDVSKTPINRLFILGLLLTFIGLVLHTVGMATSNWSLYNLSISIDDRNTSENVKGTAYMIFGLWETCSGSEISGTPVEVVDKMSEAMEKYNNCSRPTIFKDIQKASGETWPVTAHVMSVAGVVVSAGAVVASMACVLSGSDVTRARMHAAAVVSASLGAMFTAVGVFVWAPFVHAYLPSYVFYDGEADGYLDFKLSLSDVKPFILSGTQRFPSVGVTFAESYEFGYSFVLSYAGCVAMMIGWFFILIGRTAKSPD